VAFVLAAIFLMEAASQAPRAMRPEQQTFQRLTVCRRWPAFERGARRQTVYATNRKTPLIQSRINGVFRVHASTPVAVPDFGSFKGIVRASFQRDLTDMPRARISANAETPPETSGGVASIRDHPVMEPDL